MFFFTYAQTLLKQERSKKVHFIDQEELQAISKGENYAPKLPGYCF
jgi:hypothetical protein